MRQSGVIAAAALYALEHNWNRLAEDHDNARHLSQGIANIKGLKIDVPRMETNLVFFEVTKPGWTPLRLVEACIRIDTLEVEGDLFSVDTPQG